MILAARSKWVGPLSLLVLAPLLLAGCGSTSTAAGDEVIEQWLRQMPEPSGDRGWSLLSADTQASVYAGDPNAYWADLAAADWSAVSWAPAPGFVEDGVMYIGHVELLSHPSTLPRFLLERRLVAPMCIDEAPYGISVVLDVGWFKPARLTASLGRTGSANSCARRFDSEPGAEHEAFDFVGSAWGTPGPNQRVGVRDGSGLVTAVGPGRQDPPHEGGVTVASFEPGKLAIAWDGAACDSNATLEVSGDARNLSVAISRGAAPACEKQGTVVYEAILQMSHDVPPANVHASVQLQLAESSLSIPDALSAREPIARRSPGLTPPPRGPRPAALLRRDY